MSPMDEPVILSANNSPWSPAPLSHHSLFVASLPSPSCDFLPSVVVSAKAGLTRRHAFNPQGDFLKLSLLSNQLLISNINFSAFPLPSTFCFHFVHCTAVSPSTFSFFFFFIFFFSSYPCHNVIKGLEKVVHEAVCVCARARVCVCVCVCERKGRVVQRLVGFP